MPSPTIATFLPASCSFLTSSALSSGNTSLNTLSIPTCLAIALAVRLLSPVIMITSTPRLLSSLTAFILFSLSVSATAIIPASSPSTERYIGVFLRLLNDRILFPCLINQSFALASVYGFQCTYLCPQFQLEFRVQESLQNDLV